MRQQPKNQDPRKPVVNWPLFICFFMSLPLELMLHDVRSFGVRSIGPRLVGAGIMMFLFIGFHPNDNCTPLTWYLIAVIVLAIIAQICARLREWRGIPEITRYNGKPYVALLFPLPEVVVKRLEPLAVLLIGWGIHHFNHPLGSFLISSALCTGVIVGLERIAMRTRILDMNDALLEQRIVQQNIRITRRL